MDPNTSTNKSNPLIIAGIIALVAVIGLGAIILNGNKNAEKKMVATDTNMPKDETMSPSQAAPSTAAASPAAVAASDSANATKTVEVEAGSFYYKPNTITIKKGEKVKIVMHSVSMMHNFNIDELGVKMPIVKNGDTGTVEFTADKAGTFEYYCSVGQHRQMGQVGTLTVTE